MARVPLVGLLLALSLLATAAARAEDPKSIGRFGDWEAVTYKDTKGKVCYMTSNPVPAKSEGQVKNRQKAYAMVIHRPGEKSFDVVSFAAGYNYKDGSKASVVIDKQTFALYTAKDHAWARDAAANDGLATDKELVEAMRKGTDLVIKGTSARGTDTTDTYSLKGFIRAYTAISNACGIKLGPPAPAPAAAPAPAE